MINDVNSNTRNTNVKSIFDDQILFIEFAELQQEFWY
jgi:hypothetical protein